MNLLRGTPAYGILILFFLFLLQCAKISPPPGGPEDKTPPSILTTVPSGNSINVPIDNVVSIHFNEKINKPSIQGNIFISPRFAEELKYKWKDNVLNVLLPDSFADSTTYIVNVGSNISDLQKNKLENSFSFAFSTGEKIAGGKISGHVYQKGKPKSGSIIALYNFQYPDSTTPFDSIYPPYMTQSGKLGEYVLEYIPNGKYFILAFEDKNKNQLFNYPKETFGIPDRDVILLDIRSEQVINFYLTKQDTSRVSILSTSLTGDKLLKVRFSGKVSTKAIENNLSKITLFSSDTGMTSMNPLSIKERGETEISTVHLYFGPLPEGTYRLRISNDLFSGTNDSVRFIESSEFEISQLPDDNPPKIEKVSHQNVRIFPSDNIVEISFSEPIRTDNSGSGEAVEVMKADSALYAISLDRPDDMRMKINIPDLDWNEKCTINIFEQFITDMSGHPLGDSIQQYKFSTYNEDSIGSVSGIVILDPALDKGVTPYLIFTSRSGKEILNKSISEKEFNFQLPPGKYLLKGFLDKNENGEHDFGSLRPFDYSETTAHYADTVRVRARFETSGIEFQFK